MTSVRVGLMTLHTADTRMPSELALVSNICTEVGSTALTLAAYLMCLVLMLFCSTSGSQGDN